MSKDTHYKKIVVGVYINNIRVGTQTLELVVKESKVRQACTTPKRAQEFLDGFVDGMAEMTAERIDQEYSPPGPDEDILVLKVVG